MGSRGWDWGVGRSRRPSVGVPLRGSLIGLALALTLWVACGAGAVAAAATRGVAGTWEVTTTYPGPSEVPDTYTFVRRGSSNTYNVTNAYGFSAVASVAETGGSVTLDFSVASSRASDHFIEPIAFKLASCPATFTGTFKQVSKDGTVGYAGTLKGVRTSPCTRGAGIEGTVRVENDRKLNPALTGVKGALVQITGNRFKETVTVARDGSYQAKVPRAGTYDVFPRLPAVYTRGGRNPAKPAFRAVQVAKGKVATASFTVKDTLHLTLELSRESVPADGLHVVRATITATEAGAPVEGLPVSIRPEDARVVLASEVPVPGTVCLASGTRIWPSPAPGPAAYTGSQDEVTNKRGEISLVVATGTVPGSFALQAWAEDSTGHLDTTHSLLDINPEAHITINALKGGGDFLTNLKDFLKGNPSVSLPSDAQGLTDKLSQLAAAHPLGSFAFAPIRSTGGSYQAVLVYPSGSRTHFDPTGNLTPGTPGQVLSATALIAGGDFTGIARAGNVAPLPTYSNWLLNKAPGYAFPAITGPAMPLLPRTDYTYFGYGYPLRAACS